MSSATPVSTVARKISNNDENSGDSVVEEKPKKSLPGDLSKWPLDIQIAILNALLVHKPVGINASFHMAAILESIHSSSRSSKVFVGFESQKNQSALSEYDVSSNDVWNFLNANYDMAAVNLMEQTKDVGETIGEKYTEFSLPEAEFGSLMKSKREQSSKVSSRPETPPPTKQRRKGKAGGRPSAISEDTESVSSSRSSTPASGGNVAGTGAVVATRRGRPKKE